MIYVTSDLHGYPLDSFLRLLEAAGFSDADILYVLGDVIDRNGDGGIAMLRWIMSRPNVQFILGNHEDMLLSCDFLFGETVFESVDQLSLAQMQRVLQWSRNGSKPTMASLRAFRNADPEGADRLLDFLRAAPLYRTVSACGRDFLLVHSGLGNFSPEKKPDAYTREELLWTRPAPDEVYFRDRTTVFGHTPTGYLFGKRGRMFRTETWIDIDTGAAGGGAPMLLRLDDLKPFYAE